jgi:ABC-type Mn2+/Zn2+ transport system ATPase subunit
MISVIDNDQETSLLAAAIHGDGAGLAAEHLAVGYDGKPIVQDITLELGRGQALALVGMNGSGKSTLLKTIVGLLPAIQGKLSVLNMQPGGAPSRIAYLSQFQSSGFVLPLQAIDVVQMGRFETHGLFGRMNREDHDLVLESMQRMGVADLAHAPVRSLSGGQQQRVYLAQVLARRADVLVLDEPTASLDAAGKEIYTQAMEAELARGAAIIVATHDIREAARCDLVMLLARRVIALGAPCHVLTPDALLETFGIILVSQGQAGGLAVVESEHGHDCQ